MSVAAYEPGLPTNFHGNHDVEAGQLWCVAEYKQRLRKAKGMIWTTKRYLERRDDHAAAPREQKKSWIDYGQVQRNTGTVVFYIFTALFTKAWNGNVLAKVS